MRVNDIYEDGRIVKGVNTTVDVGPDEIKKQAAKFGNSVDKDGRPPTLSKKVKGSKTNVLFNLGLTEGIMLKFQRGQDFDTLHIKPKGKNRVELRGKSGYESGNYDAQDKLHQVLDKLGKAANFAELMNGETVSINLKHPDGERAKKTAQDILSTENACPRYTAYEWALMEGGHSIEDQQPVVFENIYEDLLQNIYEDLFEEFKNQEPTAPALTIEAAELAMASEIYVDMDGVLADFFTEWGKLMGKDNWRDIGIEQIPAALEKIRQTENFWLDLPLTSNAKALLSLIKDVKGSYNICSSPLPGDPNSKPHKLEWIKKNLNFFPPKDIIITHDKAKYATTQDGTPNILIDDYGKNIQQWEAAGGVGFKHKDHKFERTAKELKQHMNEPASEDAPPGREKQVKALKKKFDDPGAPYAIAWAQHNKHGKPKKKESYTREELPQIKNKHLKNIEHEIIFLNINDVVPVQKERVMENFRRQVDRLLEGEYVPIVVDCDNRIVNGHHRYDAVRLLGETTIPVARIPHTLECIIENFADGKKNEAAPATAPLPELRPADFDQIVARYKTKQPSALAELIKKFAPNILIMIAAAIGLAHLSFLQKFLVRQGIKFSQKQMQTAMAQVESIEENFADGKKKGKSRPGRVKRAGASCKGSVTSLRKKAKNASGERAKMYHWCANMKSGKKK